jgi:hypothetical protein
MKDAISAALIYADSVKRYKIEVLPSSMGHYYFSGCLFANNSMRYSYFC